MPILDRIEFRTDGVYAVNDKGGELKTGELARYLGDYVSIGEGFTLRHLVKLIEPEVNIIESAISADTCGFPLESFFKEIKKRAVKTELKWIQIEWHSVIWDGILGIHPSITLHDGNTAYGADFVPLNEICNLPIKINDELIVYSGDIVSSGKELLRTRYRMKVVEVIGGLFGEFSFHGSPTMRDKKAKSISKKIRSVKNSLNKPKKIQTLPSGEPVYSLADFKKKVKESGIEE